MNEKRSRAPRDDASGTTIGGRFVLVRRIGTGGFGSVYEAQDLARDASCALKVLDKVSAGALAQLKREFRELAGLSHPNLVRLDELHEAEGRYFFTMERVVGVDVRRWVLGDSDRSEQTTRASARRRAQTTMDAPTSSDDESASDEDELPLLSVQPDLARLRSALTQIALGLAHLHAHGKLHCDVKPSNVLVDVAHQRVVLVDFGLVTDAERVTRARSAAGTPRYMSPEAIAGERLGPASDLYSLGVIGYELMTGRTPFSGPSSQVLAAKVFGEAPRIDDPHGALPEDMVALCEALLLRDPAQRPDVAATLAALGAPSAITVRRSRAELVGRVRELEALAAAATAARAGRTVMVRVEGPSGIGKTAVVERFLADWRAREPRAWVLSARCREQDWLPYKSLDPAMDALVERFAERPPEERRALASDEEVAALAEVFPSFRELLGRASSIAPPAPRPAERRRAAADALRAVLGRIGRAMPLALWIDDAQWGDGDSARLLGDALEDGAAPILVLVASRPSGEGVTGFEDAVARDALALDARRVVIGALPPDDARALVERMSPHPDDTTRLRHLVDVADGNPFLLVELAEHARDERTATDDASGESVLLGRVARLDPDARAMLEAIVVAGTPIARRVVAKAAGLSGDEELAATATLRAARFITAHVGPGVERVEASHDRIRELTYAALAPDRRCVLHRALAAALAEVPGASRETLAFHHERAGDRREAARHAELAGDQALAALAFGRAAESYQRALSLGEHDGAARARLLERLGAAHAHAGRAPEAAGALASAAELASGRAHALELRRRAATLLLDAGHVDEGLRDLRAVLGAVGIALPSSRAALLALTAAMRARVELRGLDFTARTTVPESELLAIDACFSAAAGLSLVDTAAGALFSSLHLDRALRAGERSRVLRALSLEVSYLAASGGVGRTRRERRVMAVATELLARSDDPVDAARLHFCEGAAHFLHAEWADALRTCDVAAIELRAAERGLFHEIASAELFSLAALGWLGRWRALGERLPSVLHRARDAGDLYAETTIATAVGHFPHLADDDPRGARAALASALERWPEDGFFIQHYDALIARTDVDLYASMGRGDDALERLRASWGAVRGSLLRFVRGIEIESDFALARALLAAAGGASGLRRARWLREASGIARSLERDRAAWPRGLGALVRAGCAIASRDESAAAAALLRAERALDEAGCALIAAAAMHRRAWIEHDERTMAAARARFEGQGVRAPERVIAMFTPGTW